MSHNLITQGLRVSKMNKWLNATAEVVKNTIHRDKRLNVDNIHKKKWER